MINSSLEKQNNASPSEKKLLPQGRLQILDDLRGLAIFAMLIHHLFIMIEMFFPKITMPIIHAPYFEFIHFLFVAVFIGVSGICTNFSQRVISRAVQIIAAALAVTAASFFLFPDQPVYFGILSMFGFSMLIYGLFKKQMLKFSWKTQSVCFFLLFFVYYAVTVIAPPSELPYFLIFGFPERGFTSLDYFPLFPWIFLFFAAAALGRPIVSGAAPSGFYRAKIPFFGFFGRHTLWIYILHLPVFYGILWLISKLF